MQRLALFVFIAGVLLASCFAARAVKPKGTGDDGRVTPADRVRAWGSAAGVPFGVGVALMLAGGVWARRLRRQGATASGASGVGSPRSVVDKMDGALTVAEQAGADASAIQASVLKPALNDILEELVPEFLTLRTAMIADLGLTRFALMIGDFASLERNVARAWSALTDGAPEEIPPALDRARAALTRVGESLAEPAAD